MAVRAGIRRDRRRASTGGAGRSCARSAVAPRRSAAVDRPATGSPAASRNRSKSIAEAAARRDRARPRRRRRRPARAPLRSTGAPAVERAERGDGDRERVRDGEVAALDRAAGSERVARGAQARRRAPRRTTRVCVRASRARPAARSVGRPSPRCRRGSPRPPSSPRSNPLDHASRKSGPCTSVSVVATTRPSGAASTAASSPGPDERRARRPVCARIRLRISPSDELPHRRVVGRGRSASPVHASVRSAHQRRG